MSRTKPCSSELCSFLVSSAYYPAVGSLVSIDIFINKITCYFTFYTQITLHYKDFEGYYFEKKLFTPEMSRTGYRGQEIFFRVQNISYRLFDFFDFFNQLSIVTICMSISK